MNKLGVAKTYFEFESQFKSEHDFLDFVKSGQVALKIQLDEQIKKLSKGVLSEKLNNPNSQRLFFLYLQEWKKNGNYTNKVSFDQYDISLFFYDAGEVEAYLLSKKGQAGSMNICDYIKPTENNLIFNVLNIETGAFQKVKFNHTGKSLLLNELIGIFSANSQAIINEANKLYKKCNAQSGEGPISEVFSNKSLHAYFRQEKDSLTFRIPIKKI